VEFDIDEFELDKDELDAGELAPDVFDPVRVAPRGDDPVTCSSFLT
jgi:hypothetical protein